jgi:hypothetical protein
LFLSFFSKVGSRKFIKTQKIKAKGASVLAVTAFNQVLKKQRVKRGLNEDGSERTDGSENGSEKQSLAPRQQGTMAALPPAEGSPSSRGGSPSRKQEGGSSSTKPRPAGSPTGSQSSKRSHSSSVSSVAKGFCAELCNLCGLFMEARREARREIRDAKDADGHIDRHRTTDREEDEMTATVIEKIARGELMEDDTSTYFTAGLCRKISQNREGIDEMNANILNFEVGWRHLFFPWLYTTSTAVLLEVMSAHLKKLRLTHFGGKDTKEYRR